MYRRHFGSASLATLLLGLSLGCSGGPKRIAVPEFEPVAIAEAAISELDTDGDAVLSAEELKNSPGLAASMSVFDSDQDGSISEDELRAEFQKWLEEKTGLISIRCEVRHKGRPLKGATVRLVPESFLNSVVPTGEGETDAMGMTQISCESQHLPEALKSMRAIKPGVYRIEVTHPSESLPEKYNSQTTLGRSVSLRNSHPLSLNL